MRTQKTKPKERLTMPIAVKIILIIIAAALGIIVSYVLLLVISSLFVDGKKIYMKHSRYYRALLNSATHLAVRLENSHTHHGP